MRDCERSASHRQDAAGGRGLLHARSAELAVINEQDRAALASDAPAFVHSVRDSISAFRQIAITATVFGTTRCVL